MAELTAPAGQPEAAGRVASQQFAAILWLRWRIFANGFRRKGGAGELITRLLLLPVFAALALLPTLGAGMLSWYFTSAGNLARISWILWAAVGLTQLLNVNLGQPGTTFDPTELIRFPMPFRRYVAVRLCFGLLSPGNVIVSLMSLAIVVGVSLARPDLLLPAAVAMLLFALSNVLFTRMIFAWVDRWLSTRRARELFTALLFLFSIGFQYLNVRFNPGFQHGRHQRMHAAGHGLEPLHSFADRMHPYVVWLPPELTAGAIVAGSRRQPMLFLARTAGCAGFAATFLLVYSVRMRTEFRGENLSDAAAGGMRVPAARRRPVPLPATAASSGAAASSAGVSGRAGMLFPATLMPLLGKELLVLRRNMGLLYGLIAPAVMIFLFAGRVSSRSGSPWVLLAGVAYALLGIAPMTYNSFGTEGPGAQFYFFAPLPLHEVFLAKNLFAMLLALAEVFAVILIVRYVAGQLTLHDCVFVLLWALGTLLLNTTLGNLRSVSAPKRVKPGRGMNKAQSPVSSYISIGVLLCCAGLGFGCQWTEGYLRKPWLGAALMAVFAALATLVYIRGLHGISAYAADRRDTLFEELGKKV